MAVFPLRADGLLLRPIEFDDGPAVTDLVSDWEVARTTTHIPHPYDLSSAKAWIAQERTRMQTGEAVTLAVLEVDPEADPLVLDPPARLVGVITLRLLDGARREGEVGFWIGRPFWGRGHASTALWALLDYAFDRLGAERVLAAAMAENAASIRVQEKAGFRVVGARREEQTARGEPVDLEVRALTEGDYRALLAERLRILLVAAVALVDADGRVLLAKRPEGKPMAGLWEFPGGKVHAGETPERALVRELREELGIDITDSCLAPFTFASYTYPEFHLMMPLYVCRQWKGTVTPMEGQILNWVKPARMHRLPMPPADVPLVAMLRDLL